MPYLCPVPSAADLVPPRWLAGRYRLVRLLARGGMAEVWEGHDDLLDRDVAVKVPLAHLSDQPAFEERFRREAVAAARLSHPNVVAVHDTGEDGGSSFIVMELVRGPSLRRVLDKRGSLGVDQSVAVADQVAAALGFAHRFGVVHRDVKPGNILVERDGLVKVVDFGIAKAVQDADLTGTGLTLGTARYLSPEQVDGRPVDGRSDLYALGAVLYEMLCGKPPFVADSALVVALQHLRQAPEPLSGLRQEIPSWLEAVVLRSLEKRPEDRFASAEDLRRAMAAGEGRSPGVGRPAPEETGLQRGPLPGSPALDATAVGAVGPVGGAQPLGGGDLTAAVPEWGAYGEDQEGYLDYEGDEEDEEEAAGPPLVPWVVLLLVLAALTTAAVLLADIFLYR